MKRLAALFLGASIAGCACGQMGQPACPSLQVTSNPNSLTISGSGFSDVPNCARVSLSGLPPPEAVLLVGDPQCTNGSFQNFNWQYKYLGCFPINSRSVVVAGVDSQTSTVASQTISFPWGPTCALCGGEGQPVCADGSCLAGPPSLHPNLKDGQVVCTAMCGHTQGYSPCTPTMGVCGGSPPTLEEPQSPCITSNAGLNDFTCYDHSMIDTFGNCTCVPNTLNSCQVNSSVPKPPANDTGLCIQGQFTNC